MNRFLALLLAAWVSGNCFLHCVSVIDVWPKKKEVTEGENVVINCSQASSNSNNTGLNFTWSKLGAHTLLSNLSQLIITNVNRGDSGNYSCIATNGTANWSAVAIASITVLYPPQIGHLTRNLTVNESSTTNLFCNASGHPSPAIHWTLPNGSYTVLSNNEFLELKGTSRRQHGRYSCRASNKIGNSSSAVVYLNVQYKPQINTSGLANKTRSWLHHNSTLICLADGNPDPVVTWSKEGKEHFRRKTTGRIHVVPENSSDFGFYICTAQNALGKDEFHVEVVRKAFPPDPPKILNKEKQLSSQYFTLRWSKPAENGRTISGYFVYYRELNSNSSQGTLEKKVAGMNLNYNFTLKWDTSYEFIVTARNDQGESTKNNTMIFTVISEPTTQATKPTVSTTASSDRKSKILLYAGIAVGVGLFLVIVIIVATFCAKRMRRRDQASLARPMQPLVTLKDVQKPLSLTNSPPRLQNANTYNAVPKTRVRDINERRPKEQEQVTCASPTLAVYTNLRCLDDENPDWEFPRENVHIEKYVGKGAFCVVAKAFVDTLGIVAVKTPKEKAPESNKKDLLAEYELMKQLRHPNVIRLMGAVTRSDPVMVMFEYIPYGDLLGFLKRSRGLDDKYYKDPDVKPSSSLKSKQLLKYAREIADGMAYLAENKIIHRDLAARNVLVGEEETCKITDFGMARDVQQHDIYQKRTKGRLPVKWTAIESLLYGVSTTQSDVWSYGIVLYEIFTIGGRPYPNIQGHSIPYMLKDNYRMPKPVHLDDEIYALMSECWQTNPNSRPTFDSISTTLKRLQGRHKEIIYMNVYNDELYSNVDDWD